MPLGAARVGRKLGWFWKGRAWRGAGFGARRQFRCLQNASTRHVQEQTILTCNPRGVCRHVVDGVGAGGAWTCVEVVSTVVRRCDVYLMIERLA